MDFDFEVGKIYKTSKAVYKLTGKIWGERSTIPYLVFENTRTGKEKLVRVDKLTTDKFALSLNELL